AHTGPVGFVLRALAARIALHLRLI
ncbi:MAG: hypothetical protein ACI84R_002187, partial [Candidatus Azotimanducaceae bacterium]